MAKLGKTKLNPRLILAPSYQIGVQFCEICNINQANIYKIGENAEYLEYNFANYQQSNAFVFLPNIISPDTISLNKIPSDTIFPDTIFSDKVVLDKLPKQPENISNMEIIQEIPDYAIEQEIVENLDDLFAQFQHSQSQQHQFITIEQERRMWLYQLMCARGMKVNYIHQQMFHSSEEGFVWDKILHYKQIDLAFTDKSQQPLYETHDFNQLEAITNGQISRNIFPYMQYSEYAKLPMLQKIQKLVRESKFRELFTELTGHKPIYAPKSLDNLKESSLDDLKIYLKNAIMIERYWSLDAQYTIVDKTLAPYLDNVLYIGHHPNKGCVKQIIYNTNYQQHAKWPEKHLVAQINSASEQKMALKGEYGTLKASNLSVLTREENLYSYIKDCVITAIQAKINNQYTDNSWKEYLVKSGYEYIKIAQKAEIFIALFFNWYNQQNFVHMEFGKKIVQDDDTFYIDFYAQYGNKRQNGEKNNSQDNSYGDAKNCELNEKVGVKFFWNLPAESSIYEYDALIAKLAESGAIDRYFVMNYQKIIELNLDKFAENTMANRFFEINNRNITITNNWISEEKNSGVKKQKTHEFKELSKEDDLFYWYG